MIYNTAVEQIKGAKTAQSESMLPILRLATVTSLSGDRALIQFYGESTPSSKLYPYLTGYKPTIGDKVLVLQQGATYIIAGKISKDNVGDTYFLTKTIADTLYMPIGASVTTDRLTTGTTNLVLSSKTLTPGSTGYKLGNSNYPFDEARIDYIYGKRWGYGADKYIFWNSGTELLPYPGDTIAFGKGGNRFKSVYAQKICGTWTADPSSAGIAWSGGTTAAILPEKTINIGSGSSNQFNNVYAKQFYQNGTAISTSDRRKKTGIKDFTKKYIEFFRKLKPKLFRFKDGESGRLHSGFIAQDVEEAAAESGIPTKDLAFLCIDEDGFYGLRYEELIALQTKVIQDLMARVEALEEKVKGGK